MTDQTITLSDSELDAIYNEHCVGPKLLRYIHHREEDGHLAHRAGLRAVAEAVAAKSAAPTAGAEDSALLDWLEATGSYVSRLNKPTDLPPWEVAREDKNGEHFGNTAREAIRAAMLSHPDRTA